MSDKVRSHFATIYVVRHAVTELNTQKKITAMADVPLDGQGMRQAGDIARFFADRPLARVYTSDLKRSVQTAEALSAAVGSRTEISRLLRPIDMGDWNGHSPLEIGPALLDLWKGWQTDQSGTAPNGESFSQFQERMGAFLDGLLRGLRPHEEIACVSHTSTSRYMLAFFLCGGVKLDSAGVALMARLLQDPATVSIVKFDMERRKFLVARQNCPVDLPGTTAAGLADRLVMPRDWWMDQKR